MMIFVNAESTEIINIGVQYLRIEGACYIGIGILFMLYGYYRAINKPSMSVVLTVISLGIRVVLAYVLSRVIGVVGYLVVNSDWLVYRECGWNLFFIYLSLTGNIL